MLGGTLRRNWSWSVGLGGGKKGRDAGNKDTSVSPSSTRSSSPSNNSPRPQLLSSISVGGYVEPPPGPRPGAKTKTYSTLDSPPTLGRYHSDDAPLWRKNENELCADRPPRRMPGLMLFPILRKHPQPNTYRRVQYNKNLERVYIFVETVVLGVEDGVDPSAQGAAHFPDTRKRLRAAWQGQGGEMMTIFLCDIQELVDDDVISPNDVIYVRNVAEGILVSCLLPKVQHSVVNV